MTTTETESNWLSFQAKRVSHKLTEWGFSFKGTEGTIAAYAYTLINYNQRLWHKLF